MRVWHDNSQPFSGWHLNKITLQPITTSNSDESDPSYTFKCDRWLDELVKI